jgi:hypothetical protein
VGTFQVKDVIHGLKIAVSAHGSGMVPQGRATLLAQILSNIKTPMPA